MKNRFVVSIIAVLLLLSACEKRVDFELPKMDSKPVIQAFVADSLPLILQVNKTYGILDIDTSHTAHDIEAIDVFVNNEFEERLKKADNVFMAEHYIPATSEHIDLVAHTQQGDSVMASTYVPDKVNIQAVSFQAEAFPDEDGFMQSQVILEFQDNAATQDYYEVYIKAYCDTASFNYAYAIHSESPIIQNEDMPEAWQETLLFSDKLFDGQVVNLPIVFEQPSCLEKDYRTENAKLEVYLLHITEDYYLYKKTLRKHLYAQNSDIFDGGMVEPTNVYSNIKGGYGVFAGYAVAKYEMPLTQPKTSNH